MTKEEANQTVPEEDVRVSVYIPTGTHCPVVAPLKVITVSPSAFFRVKPSVVEVGLVLVNWTTT